MSFASAFPILHTDRLADLVAFYVGTLGLPVSYRYPVDGELEFLTVRIGPDTIGFGTYASAERVAGPVPRGAGRVQLCVYTDDLDADLARLRVAGVPVVVEPVAQPWGERLAYVRDPDDNLVMLAARAA